MALACLLAFWFAETGFPVEEKFIRTQVFIQQVNRKIRQPLRSSLLHSTPKHLICPNYVLIEQLRYILPIRTCNH